MKTSVRPRYLPPPYQDAAESGRLILRDGSTAQVRPARPDDREALRAFFERLSPESRRRRFFSASLPRPELLAALCDNSDPRSAFTLVVTRIQEGEPRIIATGSYLAKDDKTAEVAFAVDDALQGKGLGTLLLERLALLAARQGFRRFWAVTHADNRAMREVFKESGFEVHEYPEGGDIEVDLSVVPSEVSVARLEMRDRVATVASLRPFFQPKAVAVVGASRDPSSIGYRILEALVLNRFQGLVYPVNPKASTIAGIRAYPSVRDVPEPVDLAVVAVPRDAVPGVVDDCAARGVRALVIITAGFAEIGREGRDLQQKLLDKVRGYGMRMIGPNCMGLLNTDPAVRLNASFSPVFPPPGRVAMSSQSGALGLAVLSAAARLGLGMSTFVSVGNKADVSGNDLLQYWEEDERTGVILLYLESFGNPRRFARIARRVSQRKPIVVLKSGRTQAGGRAAGSHTAALAAREAAVDALFRQTGVIRADTLEEMFDLAALLGSQPLPRGRRVAIITNAGGPAILCADACEAGGLVIPEFSVSTQERLSAFLPAAASVANPVDMIASAGPEQYRQAITTVLTSGEVDALIWIYIPAGLAEGDAVAAAAREGIAQARAAGATAQPVLACWMAEAGVRTQLDGSVERTPCYAFPEAAGHVLGKAADYAAWRAQPPGMIPDFDDLDLPSARDVCQKALVQRGVGWLTAAETRTVLAAMRLPQAAGGVAATAEEAVELARQVGFPVAVKLASRQLIHKTEVGGVRLNLRDAEAVRRAFTEIRDRLAQNNQLDALEGVIVQPMISGGVEVMVGVTQDPLFGPLIAFGLGGIHVEILADVCFRVPPLTDRDAAEMVRAIKGYRLLQGYRGHPAADVEAIEEILLRVSRLVEEIPEISELDLNPIFALPPGEGCQVVDARIHVRPTP
ncbi:MAG TPA: GNAT family N-acetyltransferase [Gemmataceae bacterium]|nr:GNAT family N-acetyltransferase [Gemmataceae bacterium]